MSSAMITMFGEDLATQSGTVKTSEALAGKTVALYFSAHWCPPCCRFTPMLAEAYTSDLSAKGLEVVFISSDKDQASFDEYFGTMPWLALPFSARES
jgi:nucleoredoxin